MGANTYYFWSYVPTRQTWLSIIQHLIYDVGFGDHDKPLARIRVWHSQGGCRQKTSLARPESPCPPALC